MKNQILMWSAVAVATLLLALALMPGHPYSYFQALRVVVCFAAAFVAVVAYRTDKEGWAWACGATAALYNPFLPVHLSRGQWSVVNVLTIVLLVAAGLSIARKAKPAKP